MKYLPRTQETINHNHRDRLRNLERPTDQGRPTTEEVATFSVVGDMQVTTSGLWRVTTGGQIVAVIFEATAVGAGTTSFDILLNGTALGAGVSVAAGTTEQSDYLGNYRAARGDKLQCDITAAGMHEKVVVKVRMKG